MRLKAVVASLLARWPEYTTVCLVIYVILLVLFGVYLGKVKVVKTSPDRAVAEIPTLRMLTAPAADVGARAEIHAGDHILSDFGCTGWKARATLRLSLSPGRVPLLLSGADSR